ncbi:hypothetical protein ACRAWG_12685 [Methylobacterium sp. P31]
MAGWGTITSTPCCGPARKATSLSLRATFNDHPTIHEARNVREAGRMMEGTFGRMHELALENAQSAIA